MAISSTRQVAIRFTGDFDGNETYAAVTNTTSPGEIAPVALTNGPTTITVPTAGTTTSGLTIMPPAANTVPITLKGASGDTGIVLHLTDPTSVGLGTTQTTLVLAATGNVNVRLLWT